MEEVKYVDYIKERLRETHDLIIKTKELQILYPEQKGLRIDLKSLEHMKEDLIEKLEYCYIELGFPIYQIILNGEKIHDNKIPIKQLGEILFNFQEVPSSISKLVYYKKKELIQPVHLKESVQSSLSGEIDEENIFEEENKKKEGSKIKGILSEELTDNSQLYAFGMMEGSVRIILTSSQPTLKNEILNASFTIFKDLINCGDNKEALRVQIKKLGNMEPILKYKSFLHSLSKNNVDIEFSGKTKKLRDFDIFKLQHKEATTIYKSLNKPEEPLKEKFIKIGMLRAVDLENRTFKFHVDEEEELIIGSFDKKLEPLMEDKTFTETYKIKFESSLPVMDFKKNMGTKYELLEFVD